MIDGKEYVAEDTAEDIKGKRIDIFVASHEEANDKGVKEQEVLKYVH